MIASPAILLPAALLALWSLVMLMWMAFTRFSALKKLGVSLEKLPPGGRGQNLETILSPAVLWKAHNYTHLHEQPTVFYPICIILAVIGHGDGVGLWLAWAYFGLRVIHSIWQSVVNTLPLRFTIFLLSSLCLLGMTIDAVVCLI